MNIFSILIFLSIGAVIAIFILNAMKDAEMERRLKSVTEKDKPKPQAGWDLRTFLFGTDDSKDSRRRQVQESLQQLEERARQKRRRQTLQDMMSQAGVIMPVRQFQMISGGIGIFFALACAVIGLPIAAAAGAGLVGGFGLPRWFLKRRVKRRQAQFLAAFPDAIDIMVRALKSGLPVGDAMRVISVESPAPVGPEFLEVVEGQRIGITLEQGLERMYERISLQEINFLQIVMNIQSKSGGNLSEALGNLSRVLRDRRKMRGKIVAISQEAMSSAAIIGALPFVIVIMLSIMSPSYLQPLWSSRIGNAIIIGCLTWMGVGGFVMRKMIQLDI